MDELLEDTNNIRKLVDLNNYIDKVKIKPQKNLILAYDLELS